MGMAMGFYLLAIVILILSFVVGLIMMIFGKYKKRKKTFKTGLITFLIPVLLAASIVIYKTAKRKYNSSLTQTDVAGNYKILNSKATKAEAIVLTLKSDRTFEMADVLAKRMCESGRYAVYSGEVWINCGNHAIVAKPDRGIINLNLEFNFHDIESGDLIIVQKTDQ